jgi:hypothetical protein
MHFISQNALRTDGRISTMAMCMCMRVFRREELLT